MLLEERFQTYLEMVPCAVAITKVQSVGSRARARYRHDDCRNKITPQKPVSSKIDVDVAARADYAMK